MEPIYTIIEPGGDTIEQYKHPRGGEEFGIVLSGKLELSVGENQYYLRPGDSFYFKSSELHQWANRGKETTEVIWVISPPTF